MSDQAETRTNHGLPWSYGSCIYKPMQSVPITTNVVIYKPMQSVPITTNVVISNLDQGEVCTLHYVIKFISDLQQVGGFLQVLGFPPSIKLIVI